MPRIYTFRGKTIEELRKLSLEEFAKLLTSRERRAMRRMGTRYKELVAKVEKEKARGKVIKTHVREAVILPSWVGTKFGISDGKAFQEFTISEEMLGHRLGEYALTTKRVQHSAPGIRATRGSKFLAVK